MAKIVRTRVRTRVRTLNVRLPDPEGVRYQSPLGVGIRAGKPKADRAIRKEKLPLTNPFGVGTGPFGVRYQPPSGVGKR